MGLSSVGFPNGLEVPGKISVCKRQRSLQSHRLGNIEAIRRHGDGAEQLGLRILLGDKAAGTQLARLFQIGFMLRMCSRATGFRLLLDRHQSHEPHPAPVNLRSRLSALAHCTFV